MDIEGYDSFDDPYTKPNSTVLKNLLDIDDPSELIEFEIEIVVRRSNEPLPQGSFNPEHYCSIHHHLFQDVYEWAGQYRTVRIAKDNSTFCYPENISEQMYFLFTEKLDMAFLQECNQEEFIARISHFLGELNAIHPFREGNGRTQLVFISLIGDTCGYPFEFERVNPEAFLRAMIESFTGNPLPLQDQLKELIAHR